MGVEPLLEQVYSCFMAQSVMPLSSNEKAEPLCFWNHGEAASKILRSWSLRTECIPDGWEAYIKTQGVTMIKFNQTVLQAKRGVDERPCHRLGGSTGDLPDFEGMLFNVLAILVSKFD